MKITSYFVAAALVFVATPAVQAAGKCRVPPREYSGTFEPAFPVSDTPTQLLVSVSSRSITIGFSPGPEVFIHSTSRRCSSHVVSGRFVDNWGNTGSYVLRVGSRPSIELSDLGTPPVIHRNTIGAYPRERVYLAAGK